MSSILKSYLSNLEKMEKQVKKREDTKSSIWLQTVAGDMVEFESELAWHSNMICEKLDSGVGYTRSNPICVPPKVAASALESMRDYFQYYQTPHSNEECDLFDNKFLDKDKHTLCMLGHAAKCLQLEGLVDVICDILAAGNTKNISPKLKEEFLKYFEKTVEGEELGPQKNPNGDPRIRLSNKLLAKQKKELKEVENVKKTEAEVDDQKLEDRSIDDLVSFIDGDTKGVQPSKKKKRNRNKGKDKKKTSSGSASSSSEASAVIKNHEDISASANQSGSVAGSLKLWGFQDESFDVEGDAVDNDLDPVKMEQIDREVEAFARLLFNSSKASIQSPMELYNKGWSTLSLHDRK